MRMPRWSNTPSDLSPVEKKNFQNVQIDAVGVGIASAASPYLPVFLARLGATNSQVGLLSSMPGVTGLLLALQVGSFLQRQRRIVPWYSAGRLLVISGYALTGLVPFFLPPGYTVLAILAIWALITIPQTVTNVCFSVVMNAVAGPKRRYDLMSRRWSVLGFTSACTVFAVGQVLEQFDFPINYQIVFLGLSLGGLVSYYFSSHIALPDAEPPAQAKARSWRESVSNYLALMRSEPPFVTFISKRFVYLFGVALTAPLFPLYYVRVVEASDAAIGIINTTQTAILLFGYFFWAREGRTRGARFVTLWTTFALALFPVAVSLTKDLWTIVALVGLSGIFSAGLDLVLFDELMRTVPPEYGATFVSMAQMLQYVAAVIAPILGTTLADFVGLGGALVVGSAIRMVGFALFAYQGRGQVRREAAATEREQAVETGETV